MKILIVSDFIDSTLDSTLDRMIENKSIHTIDLILSCGDISPEYIESLKEKLSAPLYYVKGNHDIRYKGYHPKGCLNIHKKLIRFNSLKIMGFKGSMWYNGKENQFSEKEMKKIIRNMWFPLFKNRGIDIVIAHAPPRHIHDGEDLCHKGFTCFVDLIKKYSPKYFFHGHIHKNFNSPQDRATVYGKTKVINACGYHILEY